MCGELRELGNSNNRLNSDTINETCLLVQTINTMTTFAYICRKQKLQIV